MPDTTDAISIARGILQSGFLKPDRTNLLVFAGIATCAVVLAAVGIFIGLEIASLNADMLHDAAKSLCK